jgi:hypothetical protein
VRVDRRGVWLGVTKHGLADRDVLGRFVCPRTQAVTKAVPAKTLVFGNQPQLNSGWFAGLTNLAFMVCPQSGCLPSRNGEAKTKSSLPLYGLCCRNSVNIAARASHIGPGALLAFVLGALS